MLNNLLPIGSVVLLKDGIKKIMIIGIRPYDKNNPDKTYDYIGVLYPEGFIGVRGMFMFSHENIDDIIFRGYENPEYKRFIQFVEESINKGLTTTADGDDNAPS